jgi:hypothetical protein
VAGYYFLWMRPILFQCPVTGFRVQALIPESEINPDTVCVPLDCPICNRPHLIDPATGRTPGRGEAED